MFTVNSCALTTTLTSFAALGGGILNPNGTWNLKVYDRAGTDTGRVVNWSIYFPGVNSVCTSLSNALAVTVTPLVSFSSFNPAAGNMGTTVNLIGNDMNSVTSVLFNGVSAAFTIVNTSLITATVPVGATSGNITLVGSCNNVVSGSAFVVNNVSVMLNLTMLIEGFHVGSGNMTSVAAPAVSDTVTVQLRQTTTPYGIVHSVFTPLNLAGQASISIPGAFSGNSYFLVVKHRNAIETWSKLPVLMSPVVNYSFKN